MLRDGSQGSVQHWAVQSAVVPADPSQSPGCAAGEGCGTAQPHGHRKPGAPTAARSLLPVSSSFLYHSLFLRAIPPSWGIPCSCTHLQTSWPYRQQLEIPSALLLQAYTRLLHGNCVRVSHFWPFLVTMKTSLSDTTVASGSRPTDSNGTTHQRTSPQFSNAHELVCVTTATYLLTRTHKCSFPINSNLRVLLTRVQPHFEGPEVPNRQWHVSQASLGRWGSFHWGGKFTFELCQTEIAPSYQNRGSSHQWAASSDNTIWHPKRCSLVYWWVQLCYSTSRKALPAGIPSGSRPLL